MAEKKVKQKSGGAKLKAAGKKAILLGVTHEQWEQLKHAAMMELRPVTQFVVYHALRKALDLLFQQ
jgi:uncharacterized protein (DUF1778 family)